MIVSLLVLCCGGALVWMASNSKHQEQTEYERIESRYIAESGIDMAVGLFINYISNQDYVLAYTQTDNGYVITDEYAPYFLNEIKNADDSQAVQLRVIENESKDYLASVGFLDFIDDGSISVQVDTYGNKDAFKLTELCAEPSFIISADPESDTCRSKLKPIYLTVKSKYRAGEVMANIKIDGLYVQRDGFYALDINDRGSVSAWIDTSEVKIVYENYQNYHS